MPLVKLVSSLPLVGNSYVRGAQLFARAFPLVATTAIIFLSLQTSTASSRAGHPDSDSVALSSAYSARPRFWDCSVGGRVSKINSSEKGVEQGISEALKMLENCPSCREFFGDDDPIMLLKQLVRIKAIVVSDFVPKNFTPTGPNGAWRIGEIWQLWKITSAVAVTVDISPPNGMARARMVKPCIYVNPSSMLVTDGESYGDALAQVRGIVILHELAHVAGVIPVDGLSKRGTKRGSENTLCVMRNCLPCANKSSPCLKDPKSRSPRNRRAYFEPTPRGVRIVNAIHKGPVVRLGRSP